MPRGWRGMWIVALWLSLSYTPGWTQGLVGATVEERAVNGAKEYIKQNNLKNPSLTMLMIALFKHAMPTFAKQWEEQTGIKLKIVEAGAADIPAKIMAEAAAKSGEYDIFNQFPTVVPDAAAAGVILPLDDFAAKGQPDFSSLEEPLRTQQMYNGKLYFALLDGDHLLLVLRKDILELPGVKDEFQAKYGREPGCPDTVQEWEQMADFFHTKKGQTRWGKTFEQPLFGALGYRSLNAAARHFPMYFGSLWFDKDMKPRINTSAGLQALKQFVSIVKYMPPDIPSWGTPQVYPFWASGQAFSVLAFPSIVGFAQASPESKVKGQQLSCLIPGTQVDGKLVRRSPQAAGTGYMISRYSKHPELAYYFLQWLTGPNKGDEAIAHPQGFWEPLRTTNRTQEALLSKFGPQLVEVTLENSKYATALLMLPGNAEYFHVFDKHIALLLQGQATVEEAAKSIEDGWNKVTDDFGRQEQIKLWRSGVESGLYIDKF